MSFKRRQVTNLAQALGLAVGFLTLASAPGRADTPMAYTYGFGAKAYPVVSLLWGLIIAALVVSAIIAILVLVGALVRRAKPPSGDPRQVPLLPSGKGLGLVYVGTAISTLALLGFAGWTFATMAAISGRSGDQDTLLIHIIGHRWWWEVVYDSKYPDRVFRTANEIHIPTGTVVRVELTSPDVIHSFWVPQLTGKMDLIPGQHNVTWLEADRPGTYRGQCTVYCGLQHAHMALAVIAQPPAQFGDWWADQLKPAPAPQSSEIAEGQK